MRRYVASRTDITVKARQQYEWAIPHIENGHGAIQLSRLDREDVATSIDNLAAITRPEQPDFTVLIGPDATARLSEVGVIETDDQDYVIHAMTARGKYRSMLDTSGDDQS